MSEAEKTVAEVEAAKKKNAGTRNADQGIKPKVKANMGIHKTICEDY